jgi:hypothetical protein
VIRVRRVEDVAIVDWSHKDVATVVPRIRALVDAREASRVLLNMGEVESLKGEGLETLTEALSVCEDGGCALAMYGLNTYLTKLLEIMNLHAVMPTVVGSAEGEALTKLKALSLPKERAAGSGTEETPDPDIELDFDPQEAPAAPAGKSPEAVVEFEFDAPDAAPQRAKPGAAPAPKGPPLAATLRFDKAGVAPVHDGPDDILGISWAELATQGITIGGPGARDIMARAAADASAAPASELDKAAATRPTQRIPSQKRPASDELEIELEVSPAGGAQPPKREFKTEVIKTFDLNAPVDSTAATKDDSDSSDETESLEVDFEPVRMEDLGLGPPSAGFMGANEEEGKGLFGGGDTSDGEAAEWSPVDTDVRRPAPHPTPAAPTPASRGQTPPAPAHARPAPAPVPAARAPQAPPPPAQRPPTPPAPGVRLPARPAAPPAQPPRPAPVPAAQAAPPEPSFDNYQGDGGDETVMFQPDALLAEVLAAVTPDAPPAATEPAATNLDFQMTPGPTQTAAHAIAHPAAHTTAHTAAQASVPAPAPPPVSPVETPAPAPATANAKGPETHEEFRHFLSDYAIVSELHLRVLERFSREGIERVLGRADVQSAVGGSPAGVSAIIEDFVQARLLKRRRSPRVRGGIGFLYSPSPKTRNAVTRLLRLYEDGKTRAEVIGWMSSVRQAAGA